MECLDYGKILKDNDYIHVQRLHPLTRFNVNFHLHSGCEIFLLISGDVNYFVENKTYPLKYGDIIITNNREIHKPTFDSDKLYERITLHFNPDMIRSFSSPEFDLLHCFFNRKIGDNNKLTLNHVQLNEVLELFGKIEIEEKAPHKGSEILKFNYLIELLVCLNRIYSGSGNRNDYNRISDKMTHILEYIDGNLEKDLRLEILEKIFFIDKSYLCRLFKRSTGSTIHEYIIYKRISQAKLLLAQGNSVTETCGKSGFADYANFIRIFKKKVGVTPGRYGRSG